MIDVLVEHGIGAGLPVKSTSAITVTPSTTNQVLSKGQYLKDITVKGDSNFKASNINYGVSIWGVTGTGKKYAVGDSLSRSSYFPIYTESSVKLKIDSYIANGAYQYGGIIAVSENEIYMAANSGWYVRRISIDPASYAVTQTWVATSGTGAMFMTQDSSSIYSSNYNNAVIYKTDKTSGSTSTFFSLSAYCASIYWYGNNLYAVDQNANVYCINSSGTQVWKTNVASVTFAYSAITCNGTNVYAFIKGCGMYSFPVATGVATKLGNMTCSSMNGFDSNVLWYSGNLIIADVDFSIYNTSGTLVSKASVGNSIGQIAMDSSGTTVYGGVINSSYSLNRWNIANGTTIQSIINSNASYGLGVTPCGLIIASEYNGAGGALSIYESTGTLSGIKIVS